MYRPHTGQEQLLLAERQARARSPAVAAISVSGPPDLPYIRRAQPGSVENAKALTGGNASFRTRLPSGTGGWNNSRSVSFASSHAYSPGLICS